MLAANPAHPWLSLQQLGTHVLTSLASYPSLWPSQPKHEEPQEPSPQVLVSLLWIYVPLRA